MRTCVRLLQCCLLFEIVGCVSSATDSGPTSDAPSEGTLDGMQMPDGTPMQGDEDDEPAPERAEASVRVDLTSLGASVAPHAFGLHTSVYDNALHDAAVPSLLNDAGIALLRYPGGGYADNYHWSVHRMTPWDDGNAGYLAPRSDFGSYVGFAESAGASIMITVNYGSNLQGTAGGEPKEAAAWVAYANGNPADAALIGLDGSGNDWRTVGFWASLRAANPLPSDDGFNFLRISHPEPIGVVYWEIGNEVFGNGYYEGRAFELDLHAPYDDATERAGHPELSPSRYGRGVREFAQAMKAVDPSIKVGAVLNTPPNDYGWGPTWNTDVLAESASLVDFVIVHLYAGRNGAALLRIPSTRIPTMVAEVERSVVEAAGERAAQIEIAMTEVGPRPGFPQEDMYVAGLFAADVYVASMRHRIVNIDWLELHNGTFLEEATQLEGPAYHGIQIASRLASPGDTFADVEITSSWDAEALAAHAAVRADGSIGLMLANRTDGTTLETSVEIGPGTMSPAGVRYDYALTNRLGEMVGPASVTSLGSSFSVELPPLSISVFVLQPQ